ncbi:unnamed protein product [Caretta caretta]
MPGRFLHIWVCVEGLTLNLVNIYALNVDLDWVHFFWQVAAFFSTLDPHECLFLGGDFNTTLEDWDHSGLDSSQAAASVRREVVDHHSIVDVWRDHHLDNDNTFTYKKKRSTCGTLETNQFI